MAKEIERKFLVRSDGWRSAVETRSVLRQGYIASMDDRSVRVRVLDSRKARLTIKIGRSAITRDEFEYDIPVADAEELLQNAIGIVIEKTRYRVPHKGFVWEVDVFAGAHRGLVIAEVEMTSETDDPGLPSWLGREVTGDARYSNQALATEYEHDRHGLSNTA
ncbi:CYTH domain-containing protein [Rhizobium lentis]|uniref:CYTH domain-containing protein n=1 Tax=Rhizobium lentis TaxID=1138194 RepID=A0A9Q3R169_9HYPH|nr:CYTH domain-containing protein [Rhizobium lentis]MBX4957737.1 CYTH domain-containing protein [Rhizobium lentis]MBX4975667.1 CYTH domain-containing protein [Rhizobium lentis]MBX4987726.1 CYTH domain-containing protein [Rhizobium lentis]MBX5000351.1 CYTH domain-containing protein [Rhizobium lentis]MBX5006172.1 CYTH domain-containing protein [Rhizobium lentis]